VTFASTETVYHPIQTFAATAGVCVFNSNLSTYFTPHLNALQVAKYSFFLYLNAGMHVQLALNDSGASHLFLGGIGLMQPQPNTSDVPSADPLVAHQQVGKQIDFSHPVTEPLNNPVCNIWGSQSYALELCFAKAEEPNMFIAGHDHRKDNSYLATRVCWNAPNCSLYLAAGSDFDVALKLAIWQRSADVVYSTETREIVSANNLSLTNPETVSPDDLLFSFDGIFGSSYPELVSFDETSINAELLLQRAQGFHQGL
jgi:hypothetical protein